ncbi:hypothetical protein MtrunA17_Chr4g0001261 [Medicago truncatula]|nr:hypothetical protein MtrunA17_Chr4g0001261 [Medicago truncatula]
MPYPSFYLYVEKLIARFVEPTGSFSALPIITAFNCSILRAECHREEVVYNKEATLVINSR